MNLLPLLILVLLVAFLTANDSLFYLAYVVIGIGAVSQLWMQRALAGVRVQRLFPAHAFDGEQVTAEIRVSNHGRWPLLWLRLHESLPLDLHIPNFEHRIVSLAPGERASFGYSLRCRRRGYYRLGPLKLETGDLLQLTRNKESMVAPEPFIVYPRVVPLRQLGLPSQLPFGDLPSRQRMFKDPSRFFGVRAYAPGDSQRQIHWKSSARTGQWLVKRFQPAIALNTLVLLDMSEQAYDARNRYTSGELGVVIAASVAAHLVERRQEVGLALLGRDPVTGWDGLQVIPPANGREHLIRLLEALARIEIGVTPGLAAQLAPAASGLGWGSTVILISPRESEHLVPALLQLRRQGLHIVFIATDPQADFGALKSQLEQIGVPAHWIAREQDLDVWR